MKYQEIDFGDGAFIGYFRQRAEECRRNAKIHKKDKYLTKKQRKAMSEYSKGMARGFEIAANCLEKGEMLSPEERLLKAIFGDDEE